jgi:hypothetical protein
MTTRGRYGLTDVARHDTGRRLIPETRVQSVVDDVASIVWQALGGGEAGNPVRAALAARVLPKGEVRVQEVQTAGSYTRPLVTTTSVVPGHGASTRQLLSLT